MNIVIKYCCDFFAGQEYFGNVYIDNGRISPSELDTIIDDDIAERHHLVHLDLCEVCELKEFVNFGKALFEYYHCSVEKGDTLSVVLDTLEQSKIIVAAGNSSFDHNDIYAMRQFYEDHRTKDLALEETYNG